MTHPPEPAVGLYALDAAQVPTSIRQHIAACEHCQRAVEEIRAFDERLKKPESWKRPTVTPSPPETLRAFKLRLEVEYAHATAALLPYENRQAAAKFAYEFSVMQELQTGGAVRRLCEMANAMSERHPLYALTLAETAVSISADLPARLFPHQTLHEFRGQALIEKATALRFLGRFSDALASLDTAEAELAHLSHDTVGVVNALYCRASILVEQERLDEAMPLARVAAKTAEVLGDRYRYLTSTNLIGVVEFDRQQYQRALSVFDSLLKEAEAYGEDRWIALQSLNAGRCHVELGDMTRASALLNRAFAVYAQAQIATEMTRVRWAVAVATYREGKTLDGIQRLRVVITELTEHGMLTDVAEAAVDLAEMLSVAGRASDAAKVLSGVAQTLTKAGKLNGALAALRYLKEALAAGHADPAIVSYVRRFLRRAERQPSLVFAPQF